MSLQRLCALLVGLTWSGCATVPPEPDLLDAKILGQLKIQLAASPELKVEDGDCDKEDRSMIRASWDELQTSLVSAGFTLVSKNPDLHLRHVNHLTNCGFDGRIHGTASLLLETPQGRLVERVSLFPLWPDGLVKQLLKSARLLRFAQQPRPKPSPTKVAQGKLTKTSTLTTTASVAQAGPKAPKLIKTQPSMTIAVAAFGASSSAKGLAPELLSQLTEYLQARLGPAPLPGMKPRLQLAPKLLKVGKRCVVSAVLMDTKTKVQQTAMVRAGCQDDALMDAMDQLAVSLHQSGTQP